MSLEGKSFRAKKHFVHRKVANQDILIFVGEAIAVFNGCIVLSSTASFLWERLKEWQTIFDLTEALLNEFEVSYEEALLDTKEFIMMLIEKDMVEEADGDEA